MALPLRASLLKNVQFSTATVRVRPGFPTARMAAPCREVGFRV